MPSGEVKDAPEKLALHCQYPATAVPVSFFSAKLAASRKGLAEPRRNPVSSGPLRSDVVASAPVAQLDRALPSEGRGHKFESCRVRQFFQ